AQYFINHPVEIGGPGINVEINESKFGQRKYNRAHLVEGHWVFGETEKACIGYSDRTIPNVLSTTPNILLTPVTGTYPVCGIHVESVQTNDEKHSNNAFSTVPYLPA
uniref:Uncharacterized protein n=1 Tax=Amphimedon queenslandica TaxID=400682 RepID=A0A1X7TR95_AMPQE